MEEELRLRGILVERQLPVRILYKGRVLRKPLRLDMKIEKLVLVDNKAVTEWHPVFEPLVPLAEREMVGNHTIERRFAHHTPRYGIPSFAEANAETSFPTPCQGGRTDPRD